MATPPEPLPLAVALYQAKPNPMFTEEQRSAVRFLRYTASVPCAACGKRRQHHWTMLVSFSTVSMEFLVAQPSDPVHLPLTPVCRDHPLVVAPYTPPPRQRRRRKETTA